MTDETKHYHVSTKAVVYRSDGTMLALRRSDTAPSRPLEWDLPGGVLEFGEESEEGIRREIREECGLEVEKVRISDVISRYNHRKEYWVTMYFTCNAVSEDVKLSFEHDQSQWVTLEQFLTLKGSPRNTEAVKRIIDRNSA